MREASGEMEILLDLNLPALHKCIQMKKSIKLCIEYSYTLPHINYTAIEILKKETKREL